ncbi:MAG: IMPACT family protein [Bacteroidales bacterium]|nr:IMPACT family protein [Bacteroidales bacterium]
MSSSEIYTTIAAPSEGLYKEKGSKFLAFAYPVSTEDEIKNLLQDLRKKFFDARHHCYAYRLGPDGATWRVNDNGEPSSTAGKPIFGQLISFGLSDVLVVVIRYFGGIKLGVSGLINAYRTAARDALEHAQTVEKQVRENITLEYTYEQTNAVMKAIRDLQAEVIDQSFTGGPLPCRIVVAILPSRAKALLSVLNPT